MEDNFNQHELKIIHDAIEAVLDASPYEQGLRTAQRQDVRALAARCVLNEARTGDLDPVALVHKSSIMFCATRALLDR